MADTAPIVALLAGASAFVGARALDPLLDAPEVAHVLAVTRRPLGREHPRLANRIVQFDHLERQLAGLKCQVAFCCLGARLADRGGSEEELTSLSGATALWSAGLSNPSRAAATP